MKLTRCLELAACLSCLMACSARTIRLDHEPAAGSAGAPSEPDVATRVYQASGAPLVVGELLVDDRRVYWQSSDQAFRSCLKDDCQHSVVTYTAAAALDSGGLQLFSNLAASAGQAFWVAQPDWTIYSCPSAGCGTKPIRLLRDPSIGSGLVADRGEVYWTSTRDVYRCPAAGCGTAPQATALGEGTLPIFHGSDAFWIQRAGKTWRIRHAPKADPSNATTLFELDVPDDYVAIQEIAASDEFLYWVDEAWRILRCPLSGCDGEPTVLEAGDDPKVRLRADELGVYWLDFVDPRWPRAVHFCAHAGCGSDTALGTFEQLGTYELDTDFVYFTAHVPENWGALGGDIMRMRKPTL